MTFIDRFSHNNGIVKSAIRAPNTQQLAEWTAGQATSWTIVAMSGTETERDALAYRPDNYLYNQSTASLSLKPTVVWTSTAGETINPVNTSNIYWTVTGTLPSDFSQPGVEDVTISRAVILSTGEIYDSTPQTDNGFQQTSISGTLASGIDNAITFNPHSVPGIYSFYVNNSHELWRDVSFEIVASGTANNTSPVLSGTQVGTWTLQIRTDPEPDEWRINRGTIDAFTSNNNFFGLDLESGQLVLTSGGVIKTTNQYGTETYVDLLALDNSLDLRTVGANSAINISAQGENSSLNLLAESGTVNVDAILSDVTIDAIGDNRTININAGGTAAGINIAATGTNSYIQLETIGQGSSIQLEANRINSFIYMSATAAGSTVQLDGENIKILPEASFELDGNQPANPPVEFKAGLGNITFSEGVSGGRVEFDTSLRTRFLGTLDAEDSEASIRLPQKTTTQLTNENPGAAGKGRFAWNSTEDELVVWDGSNWLDVATSLGTTFGLDDGTNDAPSLYFLDDTNTGIYSAGNGYIDITIDGTKVFEAGTTTSTMRVGIVGGAVLGIPTKTDAAKAAIVSPQRGDTIFNTNSGTLNVYSDLTSTWQQLVYDSEFTSASGSLQTGIDGKVSKSGDTMTGTLDIQNDADLIVDGDATVSGELTVGSGGEGDSIINWYTDDTLRFVTGVDYGDANRFKIADATGLGLGSLFEVDSAGDITIINSLTVGDNVIVDNNTNATLTVDLNSGSNATQITDINFQDQDSDIWTIRKTASNDFQIIDSDHSAVKITIASGTPTNVLEIDANGDLNLAGSIIAPTGTYSSSLTVSGSPVRITGDSQETYLNVTRSEYGATGDGVTDDSSAIQSAIDSLAVTGGTIYFPHGTYLVGDSLSITNNDIILMGDGCSSEIHANGNFPAVVISGTNGGDINRSGVKNLLIRGGGKDNTSAHGVKTDWTNRCFFSDLVFFSCRHAIDIKDSWQNSYHNCNIHGTLGDQNYIGLYGQISHNAATNNAIIISNLSIQSTASHGVRMECFAGSKFTNCEVGGVGGKGWFFGMPSSGSVYCHFLHVANCLSDTCTEEAWYFDGDGAYGDYISDIQLANIWAGSATEGMTVRGAYNFTLDNLLFKTFSRHAVNISGSDRIDIHGGYFDNYDSGDSGNYSGVYLYNASKNCVSEGNFVSAGADKAIKEVGTSDLNRILGNDAGDGGGITVIGGGTINANNIT